MNRIPTYIRNKDIHIYERTSTKLRGNEEKTRIISLPLSINFVCVLYITWDISCDDKRDGNKYATKRTARNIVCVWEEYGLQEKKMSLSSLLLLLSLLYVSILVIRYPHYEIALDRSFFRRIKVYDAYVHMCHIK